jgi:hypothetical protein
MLVKGDIFDLRARCLAEDRRNMTISPEARPLIIVVEQGMGITGPPVKWPASERQRASYEAYLRTLRADYAAYRAKYQGDPK